MGIKNIYIDSIVFITYNTADKTVVKSDKGVISMTYNHNKVKIMTTSALLCALGIMIPMAFPSIRFGPASYTLTSHVPVIIAMFISPTVAAFVAVVTTIGFLIAGFLPVIVLRAATHLIFALIGSFILKKNSKSLQSVKNTALFSSFISLIHGAAEVAAVTYFYWINGMTDALVGKEYLVTVLLYVGVGTFIHSMVDFSISVFVWKPLQHIISIPANAKIKLK